MSTLVSERLIENLIAAKRVPLFLSEVHALASPALSVTPDASPSAWLLLPTTISAHLSGNQIPWFTVPIGPDSVNGSVRTLHGKIIKNVTQLSVVCRIPQHLHKV